MVDLLTDGLLYWIVGVSGACGVVMEMYYVSRDVQQLPTALALLGYAFVITLLAAICRDQSVTRFSPGTTWQGTPAWRAATPGYRFIHRCIAGGSAMQVVSVHRFAHRAAPPLRFGS